HPVGASGSVEVVAVPDLAWVKEEPDQGEDLLANFLQAWDRGSLKENQSVFRYGGALAVKQLQPDDLPACAFPDPAEADLLRTVMNGGPVWTVAWTEGALLTPLAVLHPGGKLWGKPALTHLVPGIPKEIF
ncbi:MAG TPA: hypothetical protein VK464_28715, partial [Symbiobacteriaceae bacterium]|nr:hypothetical protein [Symbiobacteriaceae bacterium]